MNKTILLFTTLSILSIHSQEAEVPVNEALLTSSKESKSSSISCKKYQYIAAVSTALLISSILIYILTPYPDTSTLRGFLKVAGYDKIYFRGNTPGVYTIVMKDKTYRKIDSYYALISQPCSKDLTLYRFALKQFCKKEFTTFELELKKHYQSAIDDCIFLISNAIYLTDEINKTLLYASPIYFSFEQLLVDIELKLPEELKQKLNQ